MKYRLYRAPKSEDESLTNLSDRRHLTQTLNNFNGDYINLDTFDAEPQNLNRLRKTNFKKVNKKKFK